MAGSEQTDFAVQLPRAEAIARLNDGLRKSGLGGQIMITRGVLSLPGFDAQRLLAALAAYDRFDQYNDPHGERDFGDLAAFETDLLWKIDYYDLSMEWGSPDPTDPNVTIRVLTVMLESEY
jgi:hypothetical protein